MSDALMHAVAGSGRPFVLLHAFPLAHSFWQPQIDYFSRSFRVIAPDLPGLGKSARQPEPSIPAMAKSVADFLDHLNVKEPVLMMGLSMGGYAAFEFARQFPERLRGLVLASTRANTDAPEQRQTRLTSAEKLRAGGDLALFAGQMMPKLLGKTSFDTRPQVIERVRSLILASDPQGVADAQVAMADRRDSLSILPSIRCPVLVVVGDEEAMIPLEASNEMRRALPDAHMEFIPKAGHLASIEDPGIFNERVERFLTKRFGGSS